MSWRSSATPPLPQRAKHHMDASLWLRTERLCFGERQHLIALSTAEAELIELVAWFAGTNPQCAHFVELSDEMDIGELDTVCAVLPSLPVNQLQWFLMNWSATSRSLAGVTTWQPLESSPVRGGIGERSISDFEVLLQGNWC